MCHAVESRAALATGTFFLYPSLTLLISLSHTHRDKCSFVMKTDPPGDPCLYSITSDDAHVTHMCRKSKLFLIAAVSASLAQKSSRYPHLTIIQR